MRKEEMMPAAREPALVPIASVVLCMVMVVRSRAHRPQGLGAARGKGWWVRKGCRGWCQAPVKRLRPSTSWMTNWR